MLLPLEPLVDVALDPVVDVPVEPITGALGATGALLGAVPPVEVLGGLAPPNGVILGILLVRTEERSVELQPCRAVDCCWPDIA